MDFAKKSMAQFGLLGVTTFVRTDPPILESWSHLIVCTVLGIVRVRVSPFQGFLCKTYTFIRVFPAENQRFDGPDRDLGSSRGRGCERAGVRRGEHSRPSKIGSMLGFLD